MNYRDYIQQLVYKYLDPLMRGMIKAGITPNVVTTIGFLINIVATILFLKAALAHHLDGVYPLIAWGGFIILFAGLFDMMDGRIARLSGQESTFGALWDSTLDRYSELISLFGVCMLFLEYDWFWAGLTTFLAMVGSVMVSYVRARAEGLGLSCKVGFLQRPERVVITAVCAILSGLAGTLGWLAAGMVIIAVLANFTAFWRILHCYKQLRKKQ